MINIPDEKYRSLLASEEKFRSLVKASPNAVTVSDLEGRILEVSQKTLELHRFNREKDLVGRNAMELIAPEEHARARKQMERLLEEGYIQSVDYVMLRSDGSHFVGEVNASLIKDEKGKPKAFIASTRDITGRKKFETDLINSEKLYRTMAESCPDYIFLADKDCIIHYVNSHGARQVGLSPEQMIGKEIGNFMPANVMERAKWDLQRVIDSGEPFTAEAMVPFAGRQAWVSARLVPIKTLEG